MMHAWAQPVNLTIHHMREPGYGVHVGLLFVFKAESPNDAVQTNSGLDVLIIGDIQIVVEVDKIMVPYLPVWESASNRQTSRSSCMSKKGIFMAAFLACVFM
jgi:hypothetical protein